MTWKDLLTIPVVAQTIAISIVGLVVLVAFQIMWRDKALYCNGSIFPTECSPFERVSSGAVIAFDREDGCPEGWKEHQDARGRFIVGVGSQYEVAVKKFRETGGTDQVELKTEHMPSHRHQLPVRSRNDRYRILNVMQHTDTRGRVETDVRRFTDWEGEGKPHDNMPPYIALYFCKKISTKITGKSGS